MSEQSNEHGKPLHPEQFEKYYFIVKTKKMVKDLMKSGIPANPTGVFETPEEKASQQRPYGAYGTTSAYELESASKDGKHIIETTIPTNWIQSSYGTDTYVAQDIPPSHITRHIPPPKKEK